MIKQILPDGSQYFYKYDERNNLVSSTNPLNQKTSFTYDANFNRLTGFKDANGNSVTYSYDSQGNLSGITYADGTTERYEVDAGGNFTRFVNRRGNEIVYTYNNNGQLLSKEYSDDSTVDYTYDEKGNLLAVTDVTGTISMVYDLADNLLQINYPSGRSLSYTYNADGQRTQMVSESTETFTDLTFPSNVVTLADFTPEQIAAAETIARAAGK